MKGEAKNLVWFLEGASKRFVIPVYQRNYDWKVDQCKQLFDDLVKTIKNKRKSHFFGSIVSVFNPDGGNLEFLIIDGQQRLTSVSLLFLAIYKLLNNGEIVSAKEYLAQKIFEDYLVDRFQPEDTRIKLKPIKDDQLAFGKLFENDEFISSSNITINYEYFLDRVRKEEISVDELYDAIGRLEIIDITLNPSDDNPQLIFESLNSTGLDLSEGDKIRNYILMGLTVKEQEKYYTHYWNLIEIKTAYDVSAFIRDYLSVKQQETPAMKKIYFRFKEFVEYGAFDDTEAQLADLLEYAKRYEVLIKGTTKNSAINACIQRLNHLETTVTRPFFLEVLRENQCGNISDNGLLTIFQAVESYIFRRSICDLPTNSLNKIFLTLHKDVMRFDKSADNYVDKFKYVLKSKKEKARFPNDKEFIEALMQKNIYAMPSKNKTYLFERLENENSKEYKNIYAKLDAGEYSIEHIMPQHLTSLWITALGEDYATIHEIWLHRLANLTLTAYNSSYSNLPFLTKRDMENGFKASGLKLNQQISYKEKWGLDELKDRSEKLSSYAALSLWNMVDTEYQPPEKQFDEFTLDDDIAFTGKTISKFSFKGVEQAAASWVDMYQKVLGMLHQEDKSVLSRLAEDNSNTDLSIHVAKTEGAFIKSCMIDEEIYVLTNTSTQYKINVLKKFFKLFDLDPSELVFYLRDGEEAPEDVASRHDIRLRYWTKAIPIIREETNNFLYVNPSKANWISGATGHSGVTYNCVANMDSARTELYIGTSITEQNKKVYDYLFSKKVEIEESYGGKLIWSRMNDKIASRVFIQLDEVSISNENDWDRMAAFHAESCKKLQSAISGQLNSAYENK